jgi:WD40 repeat protein/serine/threonine protein kinase
VDSRTWQRAEELIEHCDGMTPQERARYLAEACAGDGPLRGLVERALDGGDGPADISASLSMQGTVLGGWRVERELGSGGMGTVYLASRTGDELRQQAALKLVKPGMDTRDVLRRFRNERQVLADLAHPAIARLLDGGATREGRPYLVMEYVEGLPIDRFCHDRGLGLDERLQLFVRICQAVHHAHERGVVHRDLKPANILVTAEGDPKLLDFGISKLLDATGSAQTVDVTATELRLLTPEYAAPEQIRGGRITPATDVYGLGVVLYELMTGSRPYRFTSRLRGDVERVICEEEPKRLSHDAGAGDIRRRLKGDLETIVMFALRKEPTRRYATAAELAADVERTLQSLPIQARPDTWSYRSSRFVSRNRALVFSTLAIIVALALGLALSTGMYFSAERRRAEAEHRQYVSQIATASLALKSRDVAEARMRLEDTPEHLRDWEWRHLQARLSRHRAEYAAEGVVRSVAFGPNGQVLASGDEGGRLIARAVADGRELWRSRQQGNFIDVAFSADGLLLAAVLEWRAVLLFEAATGAVVHEGLAGDLRPVTLAFDGSGERLAVGGLEGELRTYEVETWRELSRSTRSGGRIADLTGSPDGRWLAEVSANGHELSLLDWSAEPTVAWESSPEERIYRTAFDRDGERLAGFDRGGHLHVWRAANGELLLEQRVHTIGMRGGLAFLDTGERLATAAGDGSLAIWDTSSGELVSRRPAHGGGAQSLDATRDGTLLATGGFDSRVRTWDAEGEEVRRFSANHPPTPNSYMDLDPEGRRLLGPGSPQSFFVWDLSGELVWEGMHESVVVQVALDPRGSLAATTTADGSIHLWDLDERRISATLLDSETGDGPSAPVFVAFAPGGELLASTHANGRLRLWDVASRALLARLDGPRGKLRRPCFDPRGELVAASCFDGATYVWSVDEPELLTRVAGHESIGVHGASLGPHGRQLATSGTDGTVRLWSVPDGNPMGVLRGHAAIVYDVAFSPDGQRLASCSGDSTVRLWDVASGHGVLTLYGHEGPVAELAFSADGSLLASVDATGEVRVWDAPPRDE